MFYIATNQICSTTGIQEDSIKEHNHNIAHTHTTSSSGGRHGHTASAGGPTKSLNHRHSITDIARDGIGGSGSIRLSTYSVKEGPKYTEYSNLTHSHTITVNDGGEHSHTTNQPSTLVSGMMGDLETRPKNRLIKIWRRTL